jgi:hypothetical protein
VKTPEATIQEWKQYKYVYRGRDTEGHEGTVVSLREEGG